MAMLPILSWLFVLVVGFPPGGSASLRCTRPHQSQTLDISKAMHGYDPFKANSVSGTGDPGFMIGKIFDHKCVDGSAGHLNFIYIGAHEVCEKSLSSKVYSSVREYDQATSGESSSGFKSSVEASATTHGFSVEASAKYASSRESKDSSAIKVLKTGKGEVVLGKATCVTTDVSLSSYQRQKFTSDFIHGLKAISKLLKSPGSDNQQTAEYVKFTRHFGTHYVKKAIMGASLIVQKEYKERSTSTSDSKERSRCLDRSVQGCLKVGDAAGAIGSVKACAERSMKQCRQNSLTNNAKHHDSSNDVTILSRGSRPVPLDKWVDEVFQPVPVKVEVAPISNLLTRTNLAQSREYGLDETLDSVALKQFFDKQSKKYCTRVLQLSEAQCREPLKGCGVAGNCFFGETCVDDSSKPKGYTCQQKTHYPHKQLVYEGLWGDWKGYQQCHRGYFVNAFANRIEKDQGKKDDTGMNAIKMECNDWGSLLPYEGRWGAWSGFQYCAGGFIGAKVQYETYQGSGYKGGNDDTSIECVELLCKDTNIWMRPYLCKRWGGRVAEHRCYPGQKICGVDIRFEKYQGKRTDDNAMTGIRLTCCNV